MAVGLVCLIASSWTDVLFSSLTGEEERLSIHILLGFVVTNRTISKTRFQRING